MKSASGAGAMKLPVAAIRPASPRRRLRSRWASSEVLDDQSQCRVVARFCKARLRLRRARARCALLPAPRVPADGGDGGLDECGERDRRYHTPPPRKLLPRKPKNRSGHLRNEASFAISRRRPTRPGPRRRRRPGRYWQDKLPQVPRKHPAPRSPNRQRRCRCSRGKYSHGPRWWECSHMGVPGWFRHPAGLPVMLIQSPASPPASVRPPELLPPLEPPLLPELLPLPLPELVPLLLPELPPPELLPPLLPPELLPVPLPASSLVTGVLVEEHAIAATPTAPMTTPKTKMALVRIFDLASGGGCKARRGRRGRGFAGGGGEWQGGGGFAGVSGRRGGGGRGWRLGRSGWAETWMGRNLVTAPRRR